MGVIVVVALNNVLPNDTYAAKLMLDKNDAPNYFSIQALMWIVFFVGLADLLIRLRWCFGEQEQLTQKLLPEDEETLITEADIPSIYRRVKAAGTHFFLPRLIRRVVLQFQTTQSVGESNNLLNSSLDLFLHEIDLRYNMLRYVIWLIPTLGFIGTVIGIANGLDTAAIQYQESGGEIDIAIVTQELGVAFFSTLLALIFSGILVLIMHLVQGSEESALNNAGQYCLDNLINRLYTK